MKAISSYTDRAQLRQLMANAKALGRDDVYWQAFGRLCELEGLNREEPIERDFYMMLCAYEELLAIKNGKRTSASRTRQKLKNKGVIGCLEDWAISDRPTEGFKALVDNHLVELTGEYLVTKYPDRFSTLAVDNARRRLAQIGT